MLDFKIKLVIKPYINLMNMLIYQNSLNSNFTRKFSDKKNSSITKNQKIRNYTISQALMTNSLFRIICINIKVFLTLMIN